MLFQKIVTYFSNLGSLSPFFYLICMLSYVSLSIYAKVLWDKYFSWTMSGLMLMVVWSVFLKMLSDFNPSLFNFFPGISLHMDSTELVLSVLSSYLKYMVFSTLFLGIPIFIALTTSDSYGGLYLDSMSGLYVYCVKVISHQWGWTTLLSYMNFKCYVKFFNTVGNNLETISINLKDMTSDVLLMKEMISSGSSGSTFIMIPVSFPVLLETISKDVNHALFILDLGVKLDSTSEKILSQYLNIYSSEGVSLYFSCFEYCGLKHSQMEGCFMTLNSSNINFY